MELITLGIGICIGVIIKSLYNRFFKKNEELNTDMCVDYLHSKGYYINLNKTIDRK